ncbi:AraC family transcriptional regulator [Nakamurella flava]|nr:AraC family transcriptional regulator [Nakamurella flava]
MARSAPPLSAHRVLRTTSLDVARASVSAQLAPHRLMPTAGVEGFRALHNAVDLDGLSLHYIDYASEVEIAVDGMGFQLVQIPLAGRCTIVAGRATVAAHPGTAVVAPPGRPLRMRYSRGNPRLMVRIGRPVLTQRVAVARAAGLDIPDGVGELDLTRGAGRSWRALVDLVVTDVDRPDGLASAPSAAAALRIALIDGLLAGLAVPGEAAAVTPHERPIRRAARLIEDHCAEPLGTPDIAEAVGLSVRALQAGFRVHLGVTPMAHLRRVRLERVRADLQQGRAASVTEAALRWGVTHLGRLSGDYRSTFGETPSQTLQRSR